jgi:hypothetical protein
MKQCSCANPRKFPSLSCPIHKNSVKNNDFGLEELKISYPEAYNSLPEAYKEDSCLVFFIDVNSHVCAEDDRGNEFIYRNNNAYFNQSCWIKIK